MANSTLRARLAVALPPLAVGVILLAAWEGACQGLAIHPFLLPAPTVIAATLIADAPGLLVAPWGTLKVALIALGLATVIGLAVAFLFVQSRLIERSFFPYAIMLQVTPIVAVAPLIIIVVKSTQAALVICATIIAVFPIISNTTIGLRSVDAGHQSLFAINRATRLQTLLHLRIPSALPFFFGGLRIAGGLALIGAVVAEFVAGTGGRGAGLAYEILQAASSSTSRACTQRCS
jgi:NitT/TauT family transport system permease protein